MEIIETSIFTRQIKELISDEEYAELQFALIQRPDWGDIIPGSGGIRKLRWARTGMGKRGGIRTIYYWHVGDGVLFMMLAYAKSDFENLSANQLKTLRAIVAEEFGNG